MSGESEEITIHILHINLQMGCTLRTIHQEGNTMGMSRGYHFLHRIYRTQHITHLCTAHQFRTFIKQFLVFIEFQDTLICHRNHPQNNSPFLSLQLPGHKV